MTAAGDPNTSVPTYQKIVAAAVLAAVLVIVAVWHSRLPADFYPLDASRVMPNILAALIQWAIILTVAALVWPPTRRRIHRFADAKAEHLKAHFDRGHAELHAHMADLHAKLDAHHAESMAAHHQTHDAVTKDPT